MNAKHIAGGKVDDTKGFPLFCFGSMGEWYQVRNENAHRKNTVAALASRNVQRAMMQRDADALVNRHKAALREIERHDFRGMMATRRPPRAHGKALIGVLAFITSAACAVLIAMIAGGVL